MTDQNQSFQEATKGAKQGILSEFLGFMKDNAKWWLIPFLIVFGLLGLLLVLGSTGAAPFIYTMF
ncbi:MAG: DUF5989 family protein [Planctomycetota bacterium]|jgi:hypothetical protein